MQDPQGVTPGPSNPQGGVTPEPSNVQVGQGQQPPQEPSNAGQGVIPGDVEALVRGLKGTVDRLEVQLLQQQQAIEQTRQPQQPQSPTENPYDYQTQFPAWQRWETQMAARIAAQESTQGIVQSLMQSSMQAAESQWQQAHPNIDINAVKAYAQINWGIRNVTPKVLDDAVSVMTQSGRIAQAQTQGAQNAINQFRQPQNAAQPVRAQAGGTPIPTEGSFEKDLEVYATNGMTPPPTWSKARIEAFDRELALRSQAQGMPQYR